MFRVQKFRSYLYGHHFTLQTDHKPLLTLFNENKAIPPQASGRIQRWALTLASFEYSIVCRSTSQHANADALSRLPLPDTPVETPLSGELVLMVERLQTAPISATQIAQWTRRDPCLSRVLQHIRTGWPEGQTMIYDPLGLGDCSSPYTMIVCCWVTMWWFPTRPRIGFCRPAWWSQE